MGSRQRGAADRLHQLRRRPRDDPANAQNRALRQVDDRRESVDLIHAQVGDGERTTAQIVWYSFASARLRDQAKFPLSLGLYGIRLDTPDNGMDWTLIMAANVMMTAPVVIVFFLFQRYFIQGMTMSGMK